MWLKHNKLSLNIEKTKCMVFHTKQKSVPIHNFSINTAPIDNVTSFKFLGIVLDCNLSWKNHIDFVTAKLSKVIGILYKLKNVYPEQALLSIYYSLFQSHINYGLLLWGKKNRQIIKNAEKITLYNY